MLGWPLFLFSSLPLPPLKHQKPWNVHTPLLQEITLFWLMPEYALSQRSQRTRVPVPLNRIIYFVHLIQLFILLCFVIRANSLLILRDLSLRIERYLAKWGEYTVHSVEFELHSPLALSSWRNHLFISHDLSPLQPAKEHAEWLLQQDCPIHLERRKKSNNCCPDFELFCFSALISASVSLSLSRGFFSIIVISVFLSCKVRRSCIKLVITAYSMAQDTVTRYYGTSKVPIDTVTSWWVLYYRVL